MDKLNASVSTPPGRWIEAVCWLALVTAAFFLCREFVGLMAGVESAVVVGLSWWLVRKTTQPFNFKRLTIMGFWYLTYMAMIFLPAFFVFADQEGPYRSRYLFAVHSVPITVPVGWLLANWFCHFHEHENERYFLRDVVHTGQRIRTKSAYWILLIPSLILMILYVRSVGTIPLFFLLTHPGDYMQVALLREDSFKLLDSPYTYAFALVRSVMFPLLVMVSFGFYLQTRSKRWRNLFIGTLAAAVFYCSLSVAKSPVAAIIAMMGFFYYYYRSGRIGKQALTVFLAALVLFPVAVISFAYSGVPTKGVFYGIGVRLFYVPSEVVYYYFEVFPHWHGFLYGRSIDKFARLMGMAPFDTANYVGVYAFPSGLQSISANAAFIGDLYADFGMPGVLVGGIVAGFVMQCFHIYAIRREKTIVAIALYSFLTFTFWFLNSSSLPIILASNGAILALVITWWFDKQISPINGRLEPDSSGEFCLR
jgi:oligosaccharide repeat unit polymerase